jgi:signal transduction histidine kinase
MQLRPPPAALAHARFMRQGCQQRAFPVLFSHLEQRPREMTDDPAISLAYLPATARQRRVVLVAAALLVVAFAATAPVAATRLPRLDAFIPTVEGMILVNDLITSILLFAQYSITPSRAVLALAAGYLFTALSIIPHLLAFPGAFAQTGLLRVGLQSAPWIYYFWHIGFPACILAYVFLRLADSPTRALGAPPASKIGWCVASVFAVVCGLTWLATTGVRFLPSIMVDDIHTVLSNLVLVNSLDLLVVAAALAALWIYRSAVLDYWLMLVLVAMLSELLLSNTLNSERFSLGYYAGRAFSLLTSIFVLGLLIEEMIRLYARLAHSNALLERERRNKLMNVEATTAAMAHEIKQPLTAIVGNAQAGLALVGRPSPDFREIKDILKDIAADGLRTSAALDGIRSLFRRVNQTREPIDINEIVLDVLHAVRGELTDHGIVAKPELTSDIPRIHGNRGQLQQVVFNLVHNAVEAMQSASDRSRMLRLTTKPGDRGAIIIAVQDSGPGIDPNRLDEMFDAFVTTKSQGMGLGLAICRLFVERHGGQLSAYSDGKTGALFQVVLPVKAADPDAPEAA